MKIIAIANQRAVVGKTTSAINIRAGLAQLKKRVLLIDLDPQANLTSSLGIMGHEPDKTIYQVLKGEVPFEAIWVERAGMKVLPSALDPSGADLELSGVTGREFLPRERIGRPWGFDEAFSVGKTIFEYNPDSQGGEDYLALCNEIIERR